MKKDTMKNFIDFLEFGKEGRYSDTPKDYDEFQMKTEFNTKQRRINDDIQNEDTRRRSEQEDQEIDLRMVDVD